MDVYKLKERLAKAIEEQKTANTSYRLGLAIITDPEYDDLVAEIIDLQDKLSNIAPGDGLVEYDPNTIGLAISDSDDRKEALPITMASMNKNKSFEEILDWIRTKNIPKTSTFVLTPKYDGVAFCVDEETNEAWTRGDGKEGQRSGGHLKMVGIYPKAVKVYTFGELIMKRKTFDDNYSVDAYNRRLEDSDEDLEYIFGKNEGYANGRNMIAGKVNDKEPHDIILPDSCYMRYGMQYKDGSKKMTKVEQLEGLNKMNAVPVPFKVVKVEDLTDEFLSELFYKWNEEFELDGVIIDVNDPDEVERLGRDTKGNPHFARAYKHPLFCDILETKITEIEWNLSKQGLLKPVVHIEPIKLNGATTRRVTGNNARFIVNMGIAVGETVKVMRSGMVIPKIIEVGGVVVPDADDKKAIKEAAKLRAHIDVNLPTHCYSCGEEYVWNENKVDLCCVNPDCPEQQLERVIAFFDVMGVDNMGAGNVTAFFDAGYDTIRKILNMTQDDMIAIDRFGKRKATSVFNSIQKGMNNVALPKVQHASGFFRGLGSRKLALVEGMENSSLDDLSKISGFAKKSAESYLLGLPKFNDFFAGLPIRLVVKKVPTSDKYKDQVIVFSGIRNSAWEEAIEDGSGKVGSSVSKKTTLLVVAELGSGTSKEVKADSLGIPVIDAKTFEATNL